MTPFAAIPSPVRGVWHLGPLPVRGYALSILVGIGVSILVTQRRWRERGGDPGVVVDVATWAVPFGVIGGRIYHLITSPQAYFGHGGHPMKSFYIWDGGLGIWGAITLGGVGAWIACRRRGILLPPFADAIAPGLLFAQAVGRWGNWFNNELYGKATDLPWKLKIYQWNTSDGHALHDSAGHALVQGYYQPAFLYESIWDVLAAFAVIWADRKYRMGHGRAFALYVVIYCVGRGWIETLRIDQANHILGLRLNIWTAMILFVGGVVFILVSSRLRPGRETSLYRDGRPGAPSEGAQENEAGVGEAVSVPVGSEAGEGGRGGPTAVADVPAGGGGSTVVDGD